MKGLLFVGLYLVLSPKPKLPGNFFVLRHKRGKKTSIKEMGE